MIVPVHMLAFSDNVNEVRFVDAPIDPKEHSLEDMLEIVFKYGQNDFQPQPHPSVSVGDVVYLNDRYFMVAGTGYKELTKDEFDNLKPPTSMYPYQNP